MCECNRESGDIAELLKALKELLAWCAEHVVAGPEDHPALQKAVDAIARTRN